MSGEQEPTPERRYASPRDEALHRMAEAGWANQSDGEEGSITGPFWRVSNSPEELDDLRREFGDQWRAIGVEPEHMLGHFVLGHFEDEGVVIQVSSERSAILAFQALRDVYVARKEGTA